MTALSHKTLLRTKPIRSLAQSIYPWTVGVSIIIRQQALKDGDKIFRLIPSISAWWCGSKAFARCGLAAVPTTCEASGLCKVQECHAYWYLVSPYYLQILPYLLWYRHHVVISVHWAKRRSCWSGSLFLWLLRSTITMVLCSRAKTHCISILPCW